MKPNTHSNEAELRTRAIALRDTGLTHKNIREELGISAWRLHRLFHGEVEPAHRNLANRAKPELQAKARDLREQGWKYDAIARKLRVSKSSLSIWLRDLPKPERHPRNTPMPGWSGTEEEWADHCYQRLEKLRRRYAEERKQVVLAGVREIGSMTDREVLIAGVMAYWCEGGKSKPWRRGTSMQFINSDPQLVAFYIRFMGLIGRGVDDLRFRVCIHENADVEEATSYWLAVTGASRENFLKPTLKRHNPKTKRKRVGDHYHGSLAIYTRRSAVLYRRVEGMARAVMQGPVGAVTYIEGEEDPPW